MEPAKSRPREVDCDLLVVGSGAAGLSAAVTAAWHGLKVIQQWALPPESVSGDGLRLGESVGGQLDRNLASPVAWCPVSILRYRSGRAGLYPHIIDRGKPGLIAVLADGRRFVNEADGYHDYVSAMVKAIPHDQEVASWLVCDHAFQRRYPFGMSKPFPVPVWPYLRSGYLKRARTVEELARICSIDARGLIATLAEYNRHARNGEDPAFGRGTTLFNPPLWRLRPQTKSLRRSDREGAFLCDQGAARQLRYVRRTENRSFRTCITRRRYADRRSVRCGKRSVERDGRTLPIRRDQPGAGDDVWLRRWTPCRWHICEIVASSLRRFQRVREQARTDRSQPLVARIMVIAEVPLLLDRKVGDLHGQGNTRTLPVAANVSPIVRGTVATRSVDDTIAANTRKPGSSSTMRRSTC